MSFLRKALSVLSILLVSVSGTNNVTCGTYVCPPGYRNITSTNPNNIACLNDICTTSTCCWVPTCSSSYGLWTVPATCGLKSNANFIQCPGNVVSGCSASLCCEPTAAPTQTPTAVPTSTPTQTPTAVPTSTPTQTPTAVPTSVPTQTPTDEPTAVPTDYPTDFVLEPTSPPTVCTCQGSESSSESSTGSESSGESSIGSESSSGSKSSSESSSESSKRSKSYHKYMQKLKRK